MRGGEADLRAASESPPALHPVGLAAIARLMPRPTIRLQPQPSHQSGLPRWEAAEGTLAPTLLSWKLAARALSGQPVSLGLIAFAVAVRGDDG